MNDLPVLLFEKILGYLSLEDRIKLRGVSRRCQTIDSFRVKSLFYSELSRCIPRKSQFFTGEFAQNLISTTRFESFFLYVRPVDLLQPQASYSL